MAYHSNAQVLGMVLYANRKVFVGLKSCFLDFSNFLFIEIWGVTIMPKKTERGRRINEAKDMKIGPIEKWAPISNS
jgi:hypothetical protein